MKFETTGIQDCYLITPTLFEDERGYFFESFNQQIFTEATGISRNFVQDNQSKSQRNVVRGLHAQQGEHAQAKLVRVLEGEVIDVAVDIRKESPTFGQIVCERLSAENKKQLYVPRGCLHGFSVLSETAIFFYKCDNFYHKESEIGVFPFDSELGIDWEIALKSAIISEKDQELPHWTSFNQNLNLR